MTALLLAGVDAGGSRLRAGVGTSADRIAARVEAAALRLRVAGPRPLAIAIAAAVRRALTASRLGPRADALVVGAAGAGDGEVAAALRRALDATGVAARSAVVTDAELVLADAFGRGPGAVLIAGTGSIALARLPDGRLVRAGGLGPASGDPGSAYAVGCETIAALEREAGAEPSPLGLTLREAAGLEAGSSLAEWARGADPSAVAALAPCILRAAAQHDDIAERVVAHAAARLAAFVAEVSGGPQGVTDVALAGGLFGDATFRERTVAALREAIPEVAVREGKPDGVRGALRIAAEPRA